MPGTFGFPDLDSVAIAACDDGDVIAAATVGGADGADVERLAARAEFKERVEEGDTVDFEDGEEEDADGDA